MLVVFLGLLFVFVYAQEGENNVPETLSYADEMAFYSESLGISGDLAEQFDEAFSAWNARDLSKTAELLTALDKQIPDKLANVKAYLELTRGLLEVDQENYDMALGYYEKAKKLVPEWWLVDAHIAEVQALKQGNNDQIVAIKLEPFQAKIKLPLKWLILTFALFAILWSMAKWRQRWLFVLIGLVLGGIAFALPVYIISAPNPFAKQSLPNSEDAKTLVDQVLTNTYRSFIFKDEEQIYDALALSVTGDELRNIYLQNRNSVKIQAAGDATMRIDNVEILEISEIRANKEGGLDLEASWQVSGFVRHFGHLHYRINAYEAKLTLIPEDDLWKIKDLSLLSQAQVL
ncbi:MAG: hypothetical protein KC422_12270 [Trueperaceae bacterium]|nr:hypothetical protein [Trueperaceae bacterium]